MRTERNKNHRKNKEIKEINKKQNTQNDRDNYFISMDINSDLKIKLSWDSFKEAYRDGGGMLSAIWL
ncbi:hypothetical protein RC95_13325 [Pectobacterium brasiliense]|nr:hypothetical protein RC95_13325 [Pectobacterium brasiliense]